MTDHKPITLDRVGAMQVTAELSVLREYLTRLTASAPGVRDATEIVSAVMEWVDKLIPILPED